MAAPKIVDPFAPTPQIVDPFAKSAAIVDPFATAPKTTPAPAAPAGPVEANLFREVADIPLGLASGAISGVEYATNVFGVDNPISETLRGVRGYVDSLLSAQAKADQQEVARIMAEAEDAGAGAQVRAALRAFAVSPLDFLAQGVGTAIPALAASILGTAGAVGYAGVQGVGLVKGVVYDAVKTGLMEQGASEAEAEQAANEAQAYTGENLDMIGLGGVIGAVTGRFGIEPAFVAKKVGDRLVQEGVERGVVNNLMRTAAAEAGPEAVQAAQEQVAQNLALSREGIDTPLGRGVVGQAALEGILGGVIGGGFGAVEAQRADTTLAEQREALRKAAEAAASVAEAPLTIDDTQTVPAEWEPVVAAEVDNDLRAGVDEATAARNAGDLYARFGQEAAAAYMRGISAGRRAQQVEEPVTPADEAPAVSELDAYDALMQEQAQQEPVTPAEEAVTPAEEAVTPAEEAVTQPAEEPVTPAEEAAAVEVAPMTPAKRLDLAKIYSALSETPQQDAFFALKEIEAAGLNIEAMPPATAAAAIRYVARGGDPKTIGAGATAPAPAGETTTPPVVVENADPEITQEVAGNTPVATGRGPGRPALELTEEQRAKREQLSRQQDTERKALGRTVKTFLGFLSDAPVNKILGKKKYAEVFPTAEDYAAFSQLTPDELDTEVKATALELRATAGLTQEQALVEAQRVVNAKQAAANEVRGELRALRGKRVSKLADVLRIATDKRKEGTAAHTAATAALQDPRVSEEELAEATRILQQQKSSEPKKSVPKKPSKPKKVTTAEAPGQTELVGDPGLVSRNALPDDATRTKTAVGVATALYNDKTKSVFERGLAKLFAPVLKKLGTKFQMVVNRESMPENLRGELAAGLYDPGTNTVYLDAVEGSDVGTTLHEFTHVATVDVIDTFYENPDALSPEARSAVESAQKLMLAVGDRYFSLLRAGRASVDLQRIAEYTDYFENLKEFIAYGLTTPSLQELMLNMAPVEKANIGVIRTAFSNFVDSIRRMLGVPSRDFSAFEELLDLTGRIAQETLRNTPKQTGAVVQAKNKKSKDSRVRVAQITQDGLREFSDGGVELFQSLRDPDSGIRELNAFWDALDEKTVRASSAAVTTNMLRKWLKSKGLAVGERVKKTMDALTVYRSVKFRDMSKLVNDWEKFLLDNKEANNQLSDLLHFSSLFDVLIYDVKNKRYVGEAESARTDTVLKDLDFKLAQLKKIKKPSRAEAAQKTRLENEIAARRKEINDVFQLASQLRKAPKGVEAIRLYAKVVTEFDNDLREHQELLVQTISNTTEIDGTPEDIESPKGRLLANIIANYQEIRKRRVYVPLMRFGKYGVRVYNNERKAVREAFYMFESMAERNLFIDQLNKTSPGKFVEVETIDNAGNSLRSELMQDSSTLKNLFSQIDNVEKLGSEAAQNLKDTLYQMYLTTLPEGNMRKAFVHRKGVLGFNNDAMRSYITTKLSNINQLSRLKYGPTLRNQIQEGYASLAGEPQSVERRKKEALIDELDMRVNAETNPPALDSTQEKLEYASRMGTKTGFMFLLSSARSAVIQPSQLVMFGYGVLRSEYGAGKTTAMAAKYLKNFMTAKALGMNQLGPNGEVVDERGELVIRNSSYVLDSKNKDALQKAYDHADLRNVFVATRIQDISGRATQEESVMRTSATEAGVRTDKAGKFVYSFMTGAMHHLERLSREVFFMSAFELEYEKQLKAGVQGDAAIEAAAEKAINLTNEAMFDYSSFNKPRFAKSWWGRMAYQFKTYQFQALGHIIQNFYKAFAASGLTREEKRKAAIKFYDTMGFGLLFGGVTGMLGYTAAVAFIDGLRDALRPDFDDEDADLFYDMDDAGNPLGLRSIDLYIRNNLIGRYFGPESSFAQQFGLDPVVAELIARGVELGPINALTDWNAQSSLALDGLVYRDTPDRASYEDKYVNFLYDHAFGAFGSVARNFARGFEAIADQGEWARGFEIMAPAAFREPMEALRFAREGNFTLDGAEIKPEEYYGAWRLLGQALGFGSTEVAESQIATFGVRKLAVEAGEAKQKIYTALEEAAKENYDAVQKFGASSQQATRAKAKLDEAIKGVQEYNYRYFYDAITTQGMGQSLRERMRRQAMTDESLYFPGDLAPWLAPLIRESRPEPLPTKDDLPR